MKVANVAHFISAVHTTALALPRVESELDFRKVNQLTGESVH